MIVVVTAEAESDLEQIASYIAEQSVGMALKFVRELREKCDSLADAPRGYPLVPRYQHLGIRRRPFGNYLIVYRIGADAINDLPRVIEVNLVTGFARLGKRFVVGPDRSIAGTRQGPES